ncbi:MBL fold metallo-hydrolase [Oceanobacillus damuensis]|uniref:MBL fold metallo-hydrolase n=1 Tax=Oceanobacillus damuensis TaxID=937928 RepID=UPI0008366A0C|nr:MBL fold metallo-hydrolase [Oceanobacillus damuensis]
MLDEYGLKVVTLDLPFRLNHVNCFIAEGEDGVQVIDAGLHNEPTIRRWEKELDGKKVTDILITHYHPDHFGYAGALQEKTGANVWMTKIDAEAGLDAWQNKFLNELTDNYQLAGIPEDKATKMISNTREFVPLVTPYPKVNHYLEEGDFIPIGKYEYEIIHTPGHSDGLVTFYNKEKDILLSTDHILPKITPNISYWFHGEPNPLKNYLNSLDKIKKLDAELVVPSHGKPFYGANKRIEEIKAHHKERLEALLEGIKGGRTVHEASEKLFNKILTIHEMRFAIGETLAHLEYLRLEGQCKRELVDGKYRYFT